MAKDFSRPPAKKTIFENPVFAGVMAALYAAIFPAETGAFLSRVLGVPHFYIGASNLHISIDAAIFILIAFGIIMKSRVAVVAGLALYPFEIIAQWPAVKVWENIIAVGMIILFIESIKGIFAYHKSIGSE